MKIYFFFLLFLLIACTQEPEKRLPTKKADQIVLIFKEAPSPWRIYRAAGGYSRTSCRISYIDDLYIPRTILPDTLIEYDTVVVETKRDEVEFIHTYEGFDGLSYLFNNGDSVLFTYDDKTPYAQILNRGVPTEAVNYALLKRKLVLQDDYPALIRYQIPFHFMNPDYHQAKGDISKNFNDEVKRIEHQALEDTEIEFQHEIILLDSLMNNQLLSARHYQFYKKKALYQTKYIELKALSHKPVHQEVPFPDLSITQNMGEQSIQMVDNVLDESQDSLLYFGYYRDVLYWFNDQYYGRKVKSIESTKVVDNVAVAGGYSRDYTALYDSTLSSPIYSKQAKRILLFSNLEQIIQRHEIEQAEQYVEDFISQVKDSAFIRYLNDEYHLLIEDSTNYSPDEDLILASLEGETMTYNQLLHKLKGKMVYVDLWASWCSPCIREFPYTDSIQQKFQADKIVFVSISKDKDEDSWTHACEKYGLQKHSYRVENLFTSHQLEQMKIDYIPHYMLYDQQGKVLQEYAPRPSDKKLVGLLEQHL